MATVFWPIWFIGSSWGIKRPIHTGMDILTYCCLEGPADS
jgi:hypothetical protein